LKYEKELTVKEWNKFKGIKSAELLGNEIQFFNFFSKRHESYEYITGQEVLLQKYIITLTDHKTKTEKVKIILKKINMTNFHKGMIKFNNGMMKFNRGMSKFNSVMNEVNSGLDNLNKQPKRKKRYNRKKQNNYL